jgi:hypothetical protein
LYDRLICINEAPSSTRRIKVRLQEVRFAAGRALGRRGIRRRPVGNPLIVSYKDILTAYTGSGKDSRLESALRRPMASMLPPDEMNKLVTWLHERADRAKYESDIKPLLNQRCMTCHDGSNPHLPNVNGFDNLPPAVLKRDGGDIPNIG